MSNEGAARLRACKLSLAELVGVLKVAGVTVTRKTVSLWRDGQRTPSDEARAAFALPPVGIPAATWDAAEGKRQAAPAEPPQTPEAPTPPSDVPNAAELASDLLVRVQRWREESEVTGSPAARKQLAELEMRAIKQMASLTGQASAPETELLRSPHWTRLRGKLLDVLETFPDAARAVRAALAGERAA